MPLGQQAATVQNVACPTDLSTLLVPVFPPSPVQQINFVPAGAQIPLGDMLPNEDLRDYVTYEGSLTTPPCSEGLLWHVLAKPQRISVNQVGRWAMGGFNLRPAPYPSRSPAKRLYQCFPCTSLALCFDVHPSSGSPIASQWRKYLQAVGMKVSVGLYHGAVSCPCSKSHGTDIRSGDGGSPQCFLSTDSHFLVHRIPVPSLKALRSPFALQDCTVKGETAAHNHSRRMLAEEEHDADECESWHRTSRARKWPGDVEAVYRTAMHDW